MGTNIQTERKQWKEMDRERKRCRQTRKDGAGSGIGSKPTACRVGFNVNSTKRTTSAALLLQAINLV